MAETIPGTLLKVLLLAVGLYSLSACTTLGPDFEDPDVGWLQDWQPSFYGVNASAETQDETELRFWWQLFNDPILNRLMTLARQENLPLRVAGLRIFESRALAGIAGSNRYPQVQQITSSASYVNNQFHGESSPSDSQRFGAYGLGLNAGWELDFWGRFRRGIESADAAFFASVANQQDMQVLLSAQIAELYFAYRVSEARIAIARKNAKIQKRSLEITEKLFNNGEQSELDLQQAKTQYLATLASVPQLEVTRYQSRNALAVLLGRAPGTIGELLGHGYDLPVISADSIQPIPAHLLSRRPDIRVAAWNVAAQSAQIGIAEADYYPAISLLGSLSWSGSSLNGAADTGSLLLGPALQWNIFDHGRIENNVRVQDARLQQLLESYQEAVLQAAREVDDAAFSLKKTAEQQVLVDEALVASERALEIANTRYREGYADFQRVLDAQRAMFAQADQQLLTRQSQIAAVINLYKSLGGGWSEMPTEKLVPEEVRNRMQKRIDWGDLLIAPLIRPAVQQDAEQENSRDD